MLHIDLLKFVAAFRPVKWSSMVADAIFVFREVTEYVA